MQKKRAFVGADIINGDKHIPILRHGTVLVGTDGAIEAIGEKISLDASVEVVDVSGR